MLLAVDKEANDYLHTGVIIFFLSKYEIQKNFNLKFGLTKVFFSLSKM